MREGIKSAFAVVTAHSAFAKATKGHEGSSKMNYGVVYTSSSKSKVVDKTVCRFFVFSKYQSQICPFFFYILKIRAIIHALWQKTQNHEKNEIPNSIKL